MDGKENLQQEEAPSISVASPRISSVGAPSEDAGRDHSHYGQHAAQGYMESLGHDHLHWGGVGQRLAHDARSVASSAAADRDDKSIYEEPGALDATEEGEEHDVHDEDEEPEEIALPQVQGELRDMPQLRTEPSGVESAFTGISAGGSLADVVDQLADQAVSGELSPRQAAYAIRSATARDAGAAARRSGGGGAGLVDGLEGSDSVSITGVAHSSHSIEQSEEGWLGGGMGGSSTADMGMDSIPLEAEAPPSQPPAAVEEAAQEPAAESAVPASEVAQVEAAAEAPLAAAAEDPAAEATAEPEPEPAAAPAAAPAPAKEEEAAEEERGRPAAAAGAAAGGAVPRTASSNYRSRLMQQLTASTSEDDTTVYSAADAAGPVPAEEPAPAPQQAVAAPAPPAAAVAAVPPAAAATSGMQALSIANGSDKAAVPMPAADTAKALAAINAAGDGGAADQQQQQQQGALPFPQQWYQTFHGLLYMDGVDALGRPVVVVNADVVPSNMKASALLFIKAHVEPLVNQGDYVLVFTSQGHTRLPSMWIMGAYRSLPRPFRKHVQHIVLVRPSAFLRTVLAFMRPFVSRKAHRKIKQVQSVHDIATATDGEVTLQSLGPAFVAEQLAAEEAAAAAAAAAGAGSAGGSAGNASP